MEETESIHDALIIIQQSNYKCCTDMTTTGEGNVELLNKICLNQHDNYHGVPDMEPHTRIRLVLISVSGRQRFILSHTVLCFHTVTVYCISVVLHFLSVTSLVFKLTINKNFLILTLSSVNNQKHHKTDSK